MPLPQLGSITLLSLIALTVIAASAVSIARDAGHQRPGRTIGSSRD